MLSPKRFTIFEQPTLHKEARGMKKNKIIKYVKIDRSRGYGNEMHAVISQSGDVYTLISRYDAKSFDMFTAHCFEDRECKQANMQLRMDVLENNKKIGLNKKHS